MGGGGREEEKRMSLNLSDHQLNRLLYAEDVIYKPNENHKSKTSNRHAKNNEKGIQGCLGGSVG